MTWMPSDPSGSCLQANAANVPFENIICLYPNTLGKTYFGFEASYDPVYIRDWMVDNPWLPITALVVYGLGITLGKSYFQNRPAWDLRSAMAMWNLGLSIFSTIGLVRTLPQLIHNFVHYSVTDNLCHDPESHYGSGPTGLWVQLFCLSKIPELFDTFFIVVHKKPLIFLHWYHHISVLLYCWHAFVTKAPSGLVFCVMNYAVHALMYFYYFLMAVKFKPKWFNSMWITTAQISQMVVGVTVTVLGFVLAPNYGSGCWLTQENNTAAMIMYGSYLFLFVQFFLGRYCVVKTSTKKKVASESNGVSTNSKKMD